MVLDFGDTFLAAECHKMLISKFEVILEKENHHFTAEYILDIYKKSADNAVSFYACSLSQKQSLSNLDDSMLLSMPKI